MNEQQLPPSTPFSLYNSNKVHRTSLSTKVQQLLLQLRTRRRPHVIAALLVIILAYLSSSLRKPTPSLVYHPKYVEFLISPDNNGEPPLVQRLDALYEESDPADFVLVASRKITVSKEALAAQESLSDSRKYSRGRVDKWETEICKAQYPWQLQTFPNCNAVHEVDMGDFYYDEQSVRFVANGYWRDVWSFHESASFAGTKKRRVLKTMRYEHKFVPRNYDRHRRDALAMERLTFSPYVVDIYGFCGNSGLFEYAPDGDIADFLWPEGVENKTFESLELLEIATMASIGLADVHNFDKEGVASIAHTDITPNQYVRIDGRYKLNDFNRARLLRWNLVKNKPCGYKVGINPGTNRSPEEYRYLTQTEKVDVYSLGNIIYMLITGKWPMEDMSEGKAKKAIMRGDRPPLTEWAANNTDPAMIVLREAMGLCFKQDPTERATARQIESMLKAKLLELQPTAMDSWGL